MKLVLTKEEMLKRRRIAGGFEPLRTDCTVEDTAGVDINAVLESELRAKYLHLLDHGPVEMLAADEVAASTAVTDYVDGGSLLEVPPECRRVLSVRLSGWLREAPVLPDGEYARVLALQRNRFTASGSASPVAVCCPDGRIAAWPGAPHAQEVTAIVDPGPDTYILDDAALPDLFNYELENYEL